MGAQLKERQMDDGQGESTPGWACSVTVACMGEERGRQSGAAAAGWLPLALCYEDGGLCWGVVVVADEERLLSLLVTPVLEEHPASPLPPLGRDASVPSLDSLQVHPSSNMSPCRGHSEAEELS